MSYTFTYSPREKGDLTTDMGGGRTETLAPGESFETSDPCEMLRFLSGMPADTNYSATPGTMESLEAEARADGCLASGDAAPANPQPAAPAAPPQDAPPPPAEADGAEAQGAPTPPVAAEVDGAPDGPADPEGPPPEPAPGEPNRTHGGERPQAPADEADPVELHSGAYALTETDLTVATPFLPLVVVRRHRSGAPHMGPFGWNWDHNHNVYLRELAGGDVARWTGRLAEDLFRAAGGGFEPPAGVFETLERRPDGSYVAAAAGGLTWLFAAPGGWPRAGIVPLARISDRFGNALAYTYDAEGRVARVAEEGSDRRLDFLYGECGLLERVEDGTGRGVDYLHAPDIEWLCEVRLPPTPEAPDGARRCYRYGNRGDHTWLRHSVTEVVDAAGLTILRNAYGRDPSQPDFARVTEQLAGGHLWQYRYTALQVVPPLPQNADLPAARTEVMEPDHSVTTYTFNHRGDVIDMRRRLVRDGSFRVVAFAHSYDGQGNRVRTVLPDGAEELRVYDDASPDPRMRGRLLRRELTARAGFPSPSRIVWRGEYEPAFQLLRRATDEAGAVTEHLYDFDLAPGGPALGRLAETRHPDALLPDGSLQPAVTRYAIDLRGRVTAVVTPTGARHEAEYAAAGPGAGALARRVLDAGGASEAEWRQGYDAMGRPSVLTDPSGAETETRRDAMGRLTEIRLPEVDGARGVLRMLRDARGAPVATLRPSGAMGGAPVEDRFERDMAGNLARATYAAGGPAPCEIAACHDHRGDPVSVTDPEGLETRLCHDERGLLLSQQALGPDGAVMAATRIGYDRAGRPVLRREGPDGAAETRLSYDAFGRLASEVLSNGSERRLAWGPGDRLVEESVEGDDGLGARRLLSRARHEYDARGRRIRTVRDLFEDDPAAAVPLVTEVFHDAEGRPERIVDARGGVTRLEHDGQGRLVRRVSASGEETRIERDEAARTTTLRHLFVEDGAAVERVEIHEHDARGRLVRRTDPLGGEWRTIWDDRDLPVEERGPEGLALARAFGPLGELLSATIDPGGLGMRHGWAYDARRAPVSYTDPQGAVTRTAYDALGRPAEVVHPGGEARLIEHDATGRMRTERLADGTRIVQERDASGLVTRLSAAGPAPLAVHDFAHDGLGRLVRAEAGGIAVTRRHDSLGRLVEEARGGVALRLVIDDAAGTVERRWPDGRRERTFTDPGGRPVRIERLAPGALGAGGPVIAEMAAPGGRLSSARWLGQVDETRAHDPAMRPVRLAFARGGAVIEGRAVSYDGRHRGRAEIREGSLAGTRLHGYDAAGRLTSAEEGFGAPPLPASLGTQAAQDALTAAVEAAAGGAATRRAYAYSPATERLTLRRTGAPDIAYAHGPDHRPVSGGGAPIAYDQTGTRAADAGRAYVSDAMGRVTRVEDAGGAVLARIAYDALGRPATVASGAGPAAELHRFGDEVWLERRGGADWRAHTPHPFGLGSIALHEAGRSLILLHDLRGSLAAVCDETGAALERHAYAPFGSPSVHAPGGAPRPAGSALDLPPVFGAMAWLQGAGLYLAGPRLMDPQAGVFTSRDPLGVAAGANPYAYAAADPVNLIDPEGTFPFLAVLAVVAVGAVIAGGVNAARQGIQIAEGSRESFSWGELGLSAGIGAVAAPILVAAPELAIPLAAWGVGSGLSEFGEGNYATGTFDVVTSLVPFGFKGPRNASFGRGSVFAPRRGFGPSATRSERLARFGTLDEGLRLASSDAWNRRFYRGTTYYEALQAEAKNMIDLDTVIGRQESAAAPPQRGPGLYFTDTLTPPVEGSAPHWAHLHGGRGRGGGPAVLEASVPRWRWWGMRRRPGVVESAVQEGFEGPATLETFVHKDLAPRFNELANWRNLPWENLDLAPPLPETNLAPLWPAISSPPYRAPDAARAATGGTTGGGDTK